MAEADNEVGSGGGGVWKKPEFQENVRKLVAEREDQILQRETNLAKAKPKFEVPIPGTNTQAEGRGGVPTAYYEQIQKRKKEETRKQVLSDFASSLPAGSKTSDFDSNELKTYIDAQTEWRLKTGGIFRFGDRGAARHQSRIENKVKSENPKEWQTAYNQIHSELTSQLPAGASLDDLGSQGFNVQAYINQQATNMVQQRNQELAGMGDAAAQRHANRVDSLAKQEQINQIKTDILAEFPQPPPGTTPEQYKKFIEDKTKERIEKFVRPRYIFLSNGMPFYLDRKDERSELERSLIGESPLRKTWTLTKYDLASGIYKGIQWVSDPSIRLKEILTDEDPTNAFGALVETGFNAGLLGLEYMRAGAYEVFITEGRQKKLEQEAEALKYTDPERANYLMGEAAHLKQQLEIKQQLNDRLSLAKNAVYAAWGKYQRAHEYIQEHDVPYIGSGSGPMRALYFDKLKKEEAAYQAQANVIRGQAMNAYGTGDYESAMRLIKEAQATDRRASNNDAYGAYTWVREPGRYEKFLDDAALVELQKGSPLSREELRRLKEYHQNVWTEASGELLFDPINFIPAVILEKAISIPLKGTIAATKAVAKEFPLVGKTLDLLGSPIRWLGRQTVGSGANKVSLSVHDKFQRIIKDYATNEDAIRAVDEIGGFITEARNAPNEQAARAIFERAKQATPGLQQISFGEFKGLMDAAEFLPPDQGAWGKMLENAIGKAEDDLTQVASQTGVDPATLISDMSTRRRALMEVASDFHGAYTDLFRVTKGGRLTDDTIAGWLTKTLRELSGEEINDALKLNGFDEFVTSVGKTLGRGTKEFLKATTHGLEAAVTGLSIIRDSWSTLVLSTPRWPITNLMDTAMRSTVYGGNLWDDMVTLFTSTQRTLADELGVVPLAFSQALSRSGLDFAETVTSRLLYEGWKPKAGFGSYWMYEYRRLFKGDAVAAKRAIMADFLKGIRNDKLRGMMTWMGDGMYVKTPLFLNAWSGAVSDFNTAVEFTFRLRMFHNEYFSLLSKLEPQFITRGMEALSPATKQIAEQIWRASEGNPQRITAYVESLKGKDLKGTSAQWNFIVPPEIERVTKGMDAADRQLFISNVRSQLDEFIQTSLKNGKELAGSDFAKFFDDYSSKFKDEIQARMAQTWDTHGMEDTIRKDGIANEPPGIDDLKGSAPIPREDASRNAALTKAAERLKKNRFARSEDVIKNFETAISDYANIERVAGDTIRVVPAEGGKLLIQVGENIKNGEKVFDQIHEAVIQIFEANEMDIYLKTGFDTPEQYDTVFRAFMDDPVSVLNDNERQFLTLVNQMDAHPQLRNILERTKNFQLKYDSAMDLYRDIGVYSDDYGFHRPPEQILETEAQKLRAQPGYHIAAVQDNALASNALARAEKTLAPEFAAIADKSSQMRERFHVFREELKQFFAFTYPGPLMQSTSSVDRHVGWELFYKMSAEEFKTEAALKQRLIQLLETDPAAAEKYMDAALNDFATYFLKENGIRIEWDADMQKIMNIKITANGRTRNIVNAVDRANLQRRFFTTDLNKVISENALISVMPGAKTRLHNQVRNALRDTFKIPTERASAWALVMENHARKWAEVTGLPISKYYERLGFRFIDNAKGLATAENIRLVKRGAVHRLPEEGGFVFYGLGQSNFESVVRETGELFYDDLVSMAEHSPQSADDLKALKKFLEDRTGKPIIANHMDVDHSRTLSDVFTSYIANGDGPDIKLKPSFEKFKGWLAQTFEGIKDTSISAEMTDEVYRVMDRLFTESKINDVPKTNKRTIKLVAQEAGITGTEDDLLKIINDSVAKELNQDWNGWVSSKSALANFPEAALKSPDAFRQHVLFDKFSKDVDDIEQQFAPLLADPNITPEIAAEITERVRIQQNDLLKEYTKMLEGIDQFDAIKQAYNSLGDVPRDLAVKVFGTPESKITKELGEAWDVWKTRRGLQGFPEEALSSPEAFKQYLRDRMLQEWSEPAAHYNRLLWEVEQMEDAILTHHAGKDFADVLFPRVHEGQISDGVRTFIRNNESMLNNYESALQALDEWKRYMVGLADNGHPAMVLPKQNLDELTTWGKEAVNAKAQMMDTILNGGEVNGRAYTGAIDVVNKRMIDYQSSNRFDGFMKNFFPFWKFPSRSFPFWAETLVTHPQLIANYEKLQRISRGQRYQAGAVTSQGKPLPSMDGYIKIPGTDMWFNPLAPMSFRYILDIASSRDDIMYAANTAEEDIEPKAWMVKELMDTGQVYGFSLAPWMAFLMKKAYGIPDEILPRYPIAPQIPLIPRWMVHDLIQKSNKITIPFLGIKVEGAGDALYPEAPWHDYLVERRILEHTLAQVQSGNLSEADKLKLVNAASEAIKAKGENDLWKSTYKDLSQEEWANNMTSFFTGFHPKQFSDTQASLLMLRNERNQLKSALNNEFQSTIFDLPADADAAWQKYLDAADTPDGWIYRLYSDIGWVRDEQGQMVRNPQERAKYLALKIEQDEKQQVYYDKMAGLYDEYNDRLRALPVGAPWEQVKVVYDWYAEERDSLQHLRSFEEYYGTNKPVELIQRDITRDWYSAVNATKPRWELTKGETYDQYQQRINEWEANLPNLAPIIMSSFRKREDLNNLISKLHADQQLDPDFLVNLVGTTDAAGLETWEKENDDIFDALNRAWKEKYWNGYWDSVIGKTGYDNDLAEHDFFTKNPEAPDAKAIYEYIQNYYGPDKFTFEEVQKWVDGTDTLTIQQRQLSEQEDKKDYTQRQEIWDMLSWLGPGGRNRDVFNTAFINAGGDPDAITVWYEESGQAYKTKPEKLTILHDAVKDAISTLGLKPPSRAELVRYVQAQDENDIFKQLIADELGNQFFDYTDSNGNTRLGVFSFYNSLSKEDKKKFRDNNAEEYDAIQQYYDTRETFGEKYPVWNDYYGMDTTPSVNVPEEGLPTAPPSLKGPVYHKPGSGGGGGQPKSTYGGSGQQSFTGHQDRGSYYPNFNITSRIGVSLSPAFMKIVGSKMSWEISQLFSSGRHISTSGQSFLRGLAARYPQYQREIQKILSRT